MLRELLAVYHPRQRGFISEEEMKLVKETLHIAEMDILALRNLRDFTVIFLTQEAKENETTENIMENWDRMSAITYVIDTEISQKGGEV
jgi:hypothetical protein